jgi:hypothetical protein
MIQETIRTPAWFAVFWVEATADPTVPSGTVAIANSPPKILAKLSSTTPLPRGAAMVAANRGLLFQTLPVLYPRAPNENDFNAFPSVPQLPSGQSTISISLLSLDGRYHPRIVSLKPPTSLASGGTSSTAAAPIYVALRPSLQGTRISESGALAINLQWPKPASGPPVPASWAVVTLTCTRNGVNYGFTGQADVNGDVIVPLAGLPPLPAPPAPQIPDVMNLTVRADISQSGISQGCDTDALLALSPAPVLVSGSSTAVPTLSIKRGQISTAATFGFAGFTLLAP